MKKFFAGKEIYFDSVSPAGRWAVVFEDDTETGYFYALDREASENSIQEALHIYNVQNVTDRQTQSTAVITWSADGQKACLRINGFPHAVFDFEAKRGYCRTNFPSPGKWSAHDFKWDDAILSHFT